MEAGASLPAETLAAIDEFVAHAPPLDDFQLAVLRPIFAVDDDQQAVDDGAA